MTTPTATPYPYEHYRHVPCRRCMALGIYIDRAIQPVIGETNGGDEILLCGHSQDAGDKLSRKPAPNASAA